MLELTIKITKGALFAGAALILATFAKSLALEVVREIVDALDDDTDMTDATPVSS